jgi:hypothetical protein
MILEVNPHELDQVGSVEVRTDTKTDTGQTTQDWDTVTPYTIRFKWLDALRTQATEKIEGRKAVGMQKRGMLIRKESRSIDPSKTRVVVGSEQWYIEAVRPYKSSRNWLVLDVWESDR